MELAKVQNGIATREPLPDFLRGLAAESLADLSWTDSSLGVQSCAWWPADDQSPMLAVNQQYGSEVLTVDAARRVVVVVRAVLALPPVLPTEADYVNAIQGMLDAKPQERRYYNMLSASTYASSTNPTFKAEADALLAWRDKVWMTAYGKFDEVTAGTIAQPTIAELLAMLPPFTWPA